MATLVTVAGANKSTVTLSYDSQQNAVLARQIAAVITAGVTGGTIQAADSKNGFPPALPAGQVGEWVQSTKGTTVLPTGYTYVVDTAKDATILSSGDKNQQILSSNVNLTFTAAAGNGSIVGGGGQNQILLSPGDAGAWQVNLGNGNDTVRALGAGNDTIAAGGGKNFIQLGSGNDQITSVGSDTIFAGSGTETVLGDPSKTSSSDVVHGNSSRLLLIATGGATVFGGSGSDTVFGGKSGSDLLFGGTAGNNFLQAGGGRATLFGSASGDQLYAAGSKPQELHAGAGNETLVGAFASGKDTFYGGSGNDQITGGAGQDTFVFGTGNATIAASPSKSAEVFQAIKDQAGGTDLITGLTNANQLLVNLQGYGSTEAANALAGQTTNGSSVTVTLSDNTKITFTGITHLTSSNFS
jgi:Ca2+-binding RTX toxin-like protein